MEVGIAPGQFKSGRIFLRLLFLPDFFAPPAMKAALFRLSALWSIALAAVCAPALAHDEPPPEMSRTAVALHPGLGSLHHAVSTRNREAQAYFDQGLKLVFAFDHEAAIQSFARAAQLDPDLAMAQWGIALALGPNINHPMDATAHKAAYEALQKAIARKSKASPAERAYIDALSKRYSANPDADLEALQRAYKDAMKDLVRRYPNDVDAAVLYAEALMDLHPWNFWAPDGTPTEGTTELVAVLERALARAPRHIGANHYYIHAVEASPHPEKALASAKRLETLAPSAGHLVHMPAHLYIRTGRYLEAARANVVAIKADERQTRSGKDTFYMIGYYGHNLHFLAIASAFAGNSRDAIAAAKKLYDIEAPRIREVPAVDGFLYTPALLLAEFGRWDEVLALPEPAFEAPLTGALWHFARSLAFAGKGSVDDAEAERAKFVEAARSVPKTVEVGNNNAGGILAVARPYLDGRLALIAGNNAGAIASFRLAVAAEDALAYDEPPGWYLPARDALGVALLRDCDYPAAERVYRDELAVHPESGRALFGLRSALAAQGRGKEAARVEARFARAWRGADVKLEAGAM
jgi:tetratricopeptide (TPR) repeat protein